MSTQGFDTSYYLNYINEAGQYSLEASKISAQSALQQAAVAFGLTLSEAEGIEAQLGIQQVTTEINTQTDLSSFGAKNALLFSGKALETYTLMAQYREKTLGLFNTISQQRAQTAWTNMKQMTQGFKF